MSDDTPNGASEQNATNTEGVSQETVNPAGQETEPANATEEAQEGISQEEFRRELQPQGQTGSQKADPLAGQAHTSKMMIAQARAEKLARENSISKTEAIVELLDEGKIKQDEANYLFKRVGDSGTETQQSQPAIDENRLLEKLRAEDKLFNAAKGLDQASRKKLVDEYKRLEATISPTEAAEFALYKSGLLIKSAQDEAYKQAQSEVRMMPPLRGASPATPKKTSSTEDQSYEEMIEQDKKDIQELQELKRQQGF